MTYPLNIAKGLGDAFAALDSSLATAENFAVLLKRLGWRVQFTAQQMTLWRVQFTAQQMTLINAIMGVSGAITDLLDALAALENNDSDPNVAAVVEAAFTVSTALYGLASADLSDIATLPAPLNDHPARAAE